jgi:hypothetical protein
MTLMACWCFKMNSHQKVRWVKFRHSEKYPESRTNRPRGITCQNVCSNQQDKEKSSSRPGRHSSRFCTGCFHARLTFLPWGRGGAGRDCTFLENGYTTRRHILIWQSPTWKLLISHSIRVIYQTLRPIFISSEENTRYCGVCEFSA